MKKYCRSYARLGWLFGDEEGGCSNCLQGCRGCEPHEQEDVGRVAGGGCGSAVLALSADIMTKCNGGFDGMDSHLPGTDQDPATLRLNHIAPLSCI